MHRLHQRKQVGLARGTEALCSRHKRNRHNRVDLNQPPTHKTTRFTISKQMQPPSAA